MPTLVSTVGGATSNSYVSSAEATTYFDERLYASAWDDAETDDQDRALIMATRRLDAEEFAGEKATSGQALKWPRIGACDQDGYEYATGVIPDVIKQATCELALALLGEGSPDLLSDPGLEAFESVKVGPIEVVPRSFADRHALALRAGALPANVKRLLRFVLASTANGLRTDLA
jgi:hypothetical protein